jgi:hypothetical protein
VVSSLVLLAMCIFLLLLVMSSTELLMLAIATIVDLKTLGADQTLLFVLAPLHTGEGDDVGSFIVSASIESSSEN